MQSTRGLYRQALSFGLSPSSDYIL